MNALISLDVTSCSWSLVPTKGEVPPARSYHAANRYKNLMLVHGGEGKEIFQNPHNNRVSFGNKDSAVDASRSVTEESTVAPTSSALPSGLSRLSQSTSVLLNEHDNSRELGKKPETDRTAALKGVSGHDGVTLGDSLCGTKLANQVKVTLFTLPHSLSDIISHKYLALVTTGITRWQTRRSKCQWVPHW